jgi:hypothetical protein
MPYRLHQARTYLWLRADLEVDLEADLEVDLETESSLGVFKCCEYSISTLVRAYRWMIEFSEFAMFFCDAACMIRRS